jgi:hypothetical protein
MLKVIDTNVFATADGRNPNASQPCQTCCAALIFGLSDRNDLLVLDSEKEITAEYRNNLNPDSPFHKLLNMKLQNYLNTIHFVELREAQSPPGARPGRWYCNLPEADTMKAFDPADRKFFAAAIEARRSDETDVSIAADFENWESVETLLNAEHIELQRIR